jgi:hypothetical protein
LNYQLLTLAYVNPGSGLLLVQLIVSGFIGAVLTLKNIRRRMFGWVRRDKPQTPPAQEKERKKTEAS